MLFFRDVFLEMFLKMYFIVSQSITKQWFFIVMDNQIILSHVSAQKNIRILIGYLPPGTPVDRQPLSRCLENAVLQRHLQSNCQASGWLSTVGDSSARQNCYCIAAGNGHQLQFWLLVNSNYYINGYWPAITIINCNQLLLYMGKVGCNSPTCPLRFYVKLGASNFLRQITGKKKCPAPTVINAQQTYQYSTRVSRTVGIALLSSRFDEWSLQSPCINH